MKAFSKVILCAMMFLQFMIVAAFFPQLAAYLKNIGANNFMIAAIMGTMAWGALASPLVGMAADRFMNGEKVLAILNAAVAVFLFMAARAHGHFELFAWLMLAMFAYMPTWGLVSSIAMSNSSPDAFPRIRVFGSIGWVCAAAFALIGGAAFGVNIDGTAIPLYCGAGVALAASVLALALPATPPAAKGTSMSLADAFGLRAFAMLKDRNTAVFMVCSAVWMAAFVIYWLFFSQFLSEALKISDITLTMSVGQISEMVFMALLPLSIKFIGLKRTMALGIFAMIVRYVMCAYSPDVGGLHWGAVAVHGIIFGFYFVAAQIYIAKKAPPQLQAQAQGMFFFVAFGAAQIAGAYFTSWLIGANSAEISEGVFAVDWKTVFLLEAGLSGALLLAFCAFFKEDV